MLLFQQYKHSRVYLEASPAASEGALLLGKGALDSSPQTGVRVRFQGKEFTGLAAPPLDTAPPLKTNIWKSCTLLDLFRWTQIFFLVPSHQERPNWLNCRITIYAQMLPSQSYVRSNLSS